MAWVTLRARRDPAFWAPIVGALIAALVFGLVAQLWTADYIRELQVLAKSDPDGARVAAERTLRGLGWFLGGFCLLIAAVFARYFQLGVRQGRLPPGGWWSLGAHRAATGTTAQRIGRVGLWLSVFLAILGIAGSLLVIHLIESLLAARIAG